MVSTALAEKERQHESESSAAAALAGAEKTVQDQRRQLVSMEAQMRNDRGEFKGQAAQIRADQDVTRHQHEASIRELESDFEERLAQQVQQYQGEQVSFKLHI